MAQHLTARVVERFLHRSADSAAHKRSVALMKFLSAVARRLGRPVAEHVYVVGGAVRDWVLGLPVKDVDVVIDSVAVGKDSDWFAQQVARAIPAKTSLVTNNYGVAILTVAGDWVLDGQDMQGEVIEIANARTESYGGAGGKGYKPSEVTPSTIQDDVSRRELTYNTLMISLLNLAQGPDKRDIIDLTGCGLRDLEEGRMQCPAPPDKVFSDDPSRMIRVIKFALRYDHKLTPDTKAAILRNAPKIRNIPGGHLVNLMTGIILKEGSWRKALEWMSDLHLLDHVREIVKGDKPFKVALLNHLRGQKLDMLFGLMDLGLPVSARVNFLSSQEQARLREIAAGMDREEAWDYLEKLKNPGLAVEDKSFFLSLAAEHGFTGRDLARFNLEVYGPAGRGLLLDDPALANNPVGFRRSLEAEVSRRL